MARVSKLLAAAVVVGLCAGVTSQARAGLTLVAQAAPGEDLNAIQVGQSVAVDVVLEGTTLGEHLVSASGGFSVLGPNLIRTSFANGPNPYADLTTDPILFIETFEAVSTGGSYYYVDYSGGNITTNLASYSPTSNVLSFIIQPVPVPEPSTWAIMAAGFAALGFVRLRKTAPQRSLVERFQGTTRFVKVGCRVGFSPPIRAVG